MTTYTNQDDVSEHLLEVGLVCSQWAQLEWLFEITFWWLLGLLDKPVEGRVVTGGLSIEQTAKRACELSHLKIADAAERQLLENLRDRVGSIQDERNLAVHGVRSWLPHDIEAASIPRGIFKNQPQKMSHERLSSLNRAMYSITTDFQALLVRLGVLVPSDLVQAHRPSQQPQNPSL